MSSVRELQTSCRGCGDSTAVEIVQSSGPHYGRLECATCGVVRAWLAKPKTTNRPAAHRDLVAKYGEGYCQLCLRKETELPGGQTLEGHHVREYQDGGQASRENVWVVCTSCAKLIHWVRHWRR